MGKEHNHSLSSMAKHKLKVAQLNSVIFINSDRPMLNHHLILKASSGETHRGREESAWLGSGYYYAQMLPSYVVIFANILALITGISTLICIMND